MKVLAITLTLCFAAVVCAKKDYQLRCSKREVGIRWPSYFSNSEYYACQSENGKQLKISCNPGELFTFVLQRCAEPSKFIPPPPMNALPTAAPLVEEHVKPNLPKPMILNGISPPLVNIHPQPQPQPQPIDHQPAIIAPERPPVIEHPNHEPSIIEPPIDHNTAGAVEDEDAAVHGPPAVAVKPKPQIPSKPGKPAGPAVPLPPTPAPTPPMVPGKENSSSKKKPATPTKKQTTSKTNKNKKKSASKPKTPKKPMAKKPMPKKPTQA